MLIKELNYETSSCSQYDYQDNHYDSMFSLYYVGEFIDGILPKFIPRTFNNESNKKYFDKDDLEKLNQAFQKYICKYIENDETHKICLDKLKINFFNSQKCRLDDDKRKKLSIKECCILYNVHKFLKNFNIELSLKFENDDKVKIKNYKKNIKNTIIKFKELDIINKHSKLINNWEFIVSFLIDNNENMHNEIKGFNNTLKNLSHINIKYSFNIKKLDLQFSTIFNLIQNMEYFIHLNIFKMLFNSKKVFCFFYKTLFIDKNKNKKNNFSIYYLNFPDKADFSKLNKTISLTIDNELQLINKKILNFYEQEEKMFFPNILNLLNESIKLYSEANDDEKLELIENIFNEYKKNIENYFCSIKKLFLKIIKQEYNKDIVEIDNFYCSNIDLIMENMKSLELIDKHNICENIVYITK